jgi:alpha-amylase
MGGQIYELDVRANGHNLLATMQRREEAYHAKVLKGQQQVEGEAASIHDRIVLKRNDLNEYLNYDQRLRKSLVDHFWDENVSLSAVASGRAVERGDFSEGSYRATIRRNPERIQVMLEREGNAWGVPLKLTKGVTLNQRSSELEIAYLLEGLPQGSRFHFGVEFNFSGLPEGQGDRFFSTGSDRQRRGHLGERLDLQGLRDLRLTDQWLGLDIGLEWDRPGAIWTFPIHSVNGSEAGFELVHQSVVVQPHFIVEADREGRWALRLRLSVNCNKPVELLKTGDTLKAGNAPTKVS